MGTRAAAPMRSGGAKFSWKCLSRTGPGFMGLAMRVFGLVGLIRSFATLLLFWINCPNHISNTIPQHYTIWNQYNINSYVPQQIEDISFLVTDPVLILSLTSHFPGLLSIHSRCYLWVLLLNRIDNIGVYSLEFDQSFPFLLLFLFLSIYFLLHFLFYVLVFFLHHLIILFYLFYSVFLWQKTCDRQETYWDLFIVGVVALEGFWRKLGKFNRFAFGSSEELGENWRRLGLDKCLWSLWLRCFKDFFGFEFDGFMVAEEAGQGIFYVRNSLI